VAILSFFGVSATGIGAMFGYLSPIVHILGKPLSIMIGIAISLAIISFILNIIKKSSFNKDKKFYETFLKLRIMKHNDNDSAMITIDSKKNIDSYQLSEIYYNIKNEPVFVIGINFINPVYKKPKPTIAIKGEGNSHATHQFISFYEDNYYIYNIIMIIKDFETSNSVYSIEVIRNES